MHGTDKENKEGIWRVRVSGIDLYQEGATVLVVEQSSVDATHAWILQLAW